MRLVLKVGFLSLCMSFVVANVGCKNDSDDSAESTADADDLMVALDATCDGEPCIAAEDAALRLESDETFVQTARGFFWLAVGFPSEDGYNSFMPTAAQDIIPMDGLSGRIEGIRESVVEETLANFPNVSNCSEAPTSGSIDMSDDETLTYEEAVNSAPASFPKTGAYDKRVTYESGDLTASFEWFCDYGGMMVKMNEERDEGTIQYVIYYDREDASDGHIEFYMYDESESISGDAMRLALKLNILDDDTFNMWLTRSGVSSDGDVSSYRMVAHSNYVSGLTSLFYDDISNTGLTTSNYSTNASMLDDSITSSNAPSATNSSNTDGQGCADNFSTRTNDITSNALCDDLDLAEGDAPGIDEDGDWTMKWIHDNLEEAMGAL